MKTPKNKYAVGTISELANGRGEFWANMARAKAHVAKQLKTHPDAIYAICRYISLNEVELVEVIQNSDGAEYQSEIDRLNRELAELRAELEAV